MALVREKNHLRSPSTFTPVKKKRYSDQVADFIQEKILQHHFATGSSLPSEHDLAAEFQVSRSVIREALRILEISGLVSIKTGPSGGIFVSNGYHKPIRTSLRNMVASGEVTIDHLFDVRLLIEPYIAEEAARHASEADLDQLRALIGDSSRHPHDSLRLKRNNLNFHLLLARASGNPVFSILLESVFELLIESSLDFLDLSLEKHFFEIHREIFDVIEHKKVKQAKRLMEKDILEVRDKLKGFRTTP